MAVKKKVAAPAVKKPPTKSGLTRKDVASVFTALEGVIAKEMKPRGSGLFNLVGLCKIKVVKKPATKARKGINPFTGEETVFKAKPARKAVKILPLKGLKDMV
jgi:nucleoid DNA-binding protein